MMAKAAAMASQPARPGRQQHSRCVAGHGGRYDRDGRGLGGDQDGQAVAGEDQPLVEGQRPADGGEHGESCTARK